MSRCIFVFMLSMLFCVVLQSCGVGEPVENIYEDEKHVFDGWHSTFEKRTVGDYFGEANKYEVNFSTTNPLEPKTVQKNGQGLLQEVVQYSGIKDIAYAVCRRIADGTSFYSTDLYLAYGKPLKDLSKLPADLKLNIEIRACGNFQTDHGNETPDIYMKDGKLFFYRRGFIKDDGSFDCSIEEQHKGICQWNAGRVEFYMGKNGVIVAAFGDRHKTIFDNLRFFRNGLLTNVKPDKVIRGSTDMDTGYSSFTAKAQPTGLPYSLQLEQDKPASYRTRYFSEDVESISYYRAVADQAYVSCAMSDTEHKNTQINWQDNKIFFIKAAKLLTKQQMGDFTLTKAVNNCKKVGAEPVVKFESKAGKIFATIDGIKGLVDERGNFKIGDNKGRVKFYNSANASLMALYYYQEGEGEYSGLVVDNSQPISSQDYNHAYRWSQIMPNLDFVKNHAIIRSGKKLKQVMLQGEDTVKEVTKYVSLGQVAYSYCTVDSAEQYPNINEINKQSKTIINTAQLHQLTDPNAEFGRTEVIMKKGAFICYPTRNGSRLTFKIKRGEFRVSVGGQQDLESKINDDGSFSGNGIISGKVKFYIDKYKKAYAIYSATLQVSSSGKKEYTNGIASNADWISDNNQYYWNYNLYDDDKNVFAHNYLHFDAGMPQWSRKGGMTIFSNPKDFQPIPIKEKLYGVANVFYRPCKATEIYNGSYFLNRDLTQVVIKGELDNDDFVLERVDSIGSAKSAIKQIVRRNGHILLITEQGEIEIDRPSDNLRHTTPVLTSKDGKYEVEFYRHRLSKKLLAFRLGGGLFMDVKAKDLVGGCESGIGD